MIVSTNGLSSCGKRNYARPLRISSPTLKMRADAQAEGKLGSNTAYYVTDTGARLGATENDLFRKKQSSVVKKYSNHTPSPETEAGHPFKMPNPSYWDGNDGFSMEGFNRRLYLLQQGTPLGGNTLPLSWHQAASVLIMGGFFTEKNFEDFGGVTALMSWYERVHQEVEAFFRSIPEKVDFLVGLAEDSGPSSGIGHRQHWKRRSVTPSSMGLAQ